MSDTSVASVDALLVTQLAIHPYQMETHGSSLPMLQLWEVRHLPSRSFDTSRTPAAHFASNQPEAAASIVFRICRAVHEVCIHPDWPSLLR